MDWFKKELKRYSWDVPYLGDQRLTTGVFFTPALGAVKVKVVKQLCKKGLLELRRHAISSDIAIAGLTKKGYYYCIEHDLIKIEKVLKEEV